MVAVHLLFKKKAWQRTILSFFLVFMLAGCQQETTQVPSSQSTNEKLVISVDAGLVTKDFRDFVDKFAKEKDIEMQIKERPSGSAGENEVVTELVTFNGPDILLFSSGGLFKSLDPQEYFYDLTNESYTKEYSDSYRQSVSAGKQVYGVPLSSGDAIGFLYNKELYQKYDLDVPKNLRDFNNNLATLYEHGITPLLAPFKDQWLTQYYWYVAENTSPPNYGEILEQVSFWKEKDYFTEERLTLSLSGGLESFSKGESAHFLCQSGFIQYLTDSNQMSEDSVGFFNFPNGRGSVYMLPSSLYINKETEQLDLSRAFLAAYFEEKVLQQQTSEEHPSVLKNAKVQAEPIISEQKAAYKVDILPELLLDFFTNTISKEEVLKQYNERDKELYLLY